MRRRRDPSAAAPTAPCRDKAFELLARRDHFRVELERKLLDRGYDAVEVAETLDRLAADGHLDERRTAETWLDIRLSTRAEGPLRLVAELRRRGADSDLARELVDAHFVDGDLDAARDTAERWHARRTGGADPRAALARHLERKGFTGASIGRVLDELD